VPWAGSGVCGEVRTGPRRWPKPACESPGLNPREREIIQLVAEGKATQGVAEMLGISVKTAETHRTNLMRQLNLPFTAEVVRYAIRNQIVPP